MTAPEMRVGLRVFYNSSWMGGVNYVLGLARVVRALPDSERPRMFFLTDGPEAQRIARANSVLVDEIAAFERASELQLDFVYPATQLAEAPFGAPWAGWIPDWQCQHYPELFSEAEKTRRRIQYGILAQDAACCVFSSLQAMEDTKRLFPDSSVRMRLLHFPANLPERVFDRNQEQAKFVRERLALPARYLVVCNQFWRHKNHAVILEALRRAPKLDVHIVMTGEFDDERWPEYTGGLRHLLEDSSVARRVTVTGRIDRDHQIDLMCGAAGIIQPSLFEGWSSFVEEARALGLPALLSDIPVHREQNPSGSRFFDPNNADELVELLDRWCLDAPSKPDLAVARGRHVTFSLDCARAFLQIARETRDEWVMQSNGVKSIAARKLLELRDAVGVSIDRHDYDLFCAGVRQLFRTHPHELARFATMVCAPGHPLEDEAPQNIVVATLAKMSQADRGRFFAYRPEDDSQVGRPSSAFSALVGEHGTALGRGKLAAADAFERVRDLARRKLKH